MINTYKITSIFLIVFTLISPPFLFAEAIYFGREVRIFFLFLILLYIYSNYSNFKLTNLFFIYLLGLIGILNLILEQSDINNVLSFNGIIIMVISLFVVLKSNKIFFNYFLNSWLRFSFVLAFTAIISFLINQFTGENYFIFDLKLLNNYVEAYNYKISIFGFTIDKDFGFIVLARVCSFFNEPQYAGLFFAFNTYLAKVNNNLISRKYFLIFLLAGILTFSVTFFIFFLVILISYINLYKLISVFFVLLIMLLIFFWFNENIISNEIKIFLSSTSFLDRYERNLNGINVLYNSSKFNIFFGHGINTFLKFNLEDGRALSSGFLYIIFEHGFLYLFIILIMLISFCKKDLTLVFISIIYLISMPWYKYPFCWIAIILCGLSYFKNFNNKIANKKNVFLY